MGRILPGFIEQPNLDTPLSPGPSLATRTSHKNNGWKPPVPATKPLPKQSASPAIKPAPKDVVFTRELRSRGLKFSGVKLQEDDRRKPIYPKELLSFIQEEEVDFVNEQESDLNRELPSSDSSSSSPKPPEPSEALMLDHLPQEKSSSLKPHAPESSEANMMVHLPREEEKTRHSDYD